MDRPKTSGRTNRRKAEKSLRVIKRNGKEVVFNPAKIQNAISKAGGTLVDVSLIVEQCEHLNRAVHVEEW